MSLTIIEKPEDLMGKEGLKVGPSEWMEMTQERVNTFADATGDHQWIHIDEEKAKKGPYGATIAHGYLTLSLAAKLMPEVLEIKGTSMAINYGTDKVRFLNPVKVGSRIRGHGEFLENKEVPGGYQSTLRFTIEIEGEDKPACVIDSISRYYI
ncbi:MaoC family dehydratase [Oceaniserpentilla sp. 4NH20-0058]|uniref:MaoC family dehydratase n=1 Tax=Oceaniserpentilla sp. 4NH20-0058 TaxID=3127660 RepID=UPI00310B325F